MAKPKDVSEIFKDVDKDLAEAKGEFDAASAESKPYTEPKAAIKAVADEQKAREQAAADFQKKKDAKEQNTIERAPTGVDGFDQLIEGGFVRGSSVVLTGGAGSGKSTFALQYLYYGATHGEPGIYVTFEQDAEDLKEMAMRFGMDIDELEKKNMLTIMSVDPSKIMNLVKEGYGQIVEEIRRLGARRIVIDSLSAFSIMMKENFERRRILLNFSRWLKRHNTTTLMISEIGQSLSTDRQFDVSEFMADGVIILYDLLRQNIRERALEVLKMRKTDTIRKVCPFRFEDTGVVVYPEEELFRFLSPSG